MTPEIILLQDPFPHVIIKNIYDERELNLIWRELDFITSPYKFDTGENDGSTGMSLSGINPSQNHGLTLDVVYAYKRNVSDILTITNKLASDYFTEEIMKVSPLVGHLKYCNRSTTKVKYYENGDYYRGHHDIARFSFLTYLFKEPKMFTGGNLHFDDYDYTIEIENNMTVFFVGSILHSSTELKMSRDLTPWSGHGKYCITQFIDHIESPSHK